MIDAALSEVQTHPPIENLVPHQPPMVWLDELVHWEPGHVRCRSTITPETAFVRDGTLSTIVLLEYMAQAVAVCLGYGALRNGEDIRVGMIVACRSFELPVDRVEVGAVLTVEARRLREVEAVSNFECSVSREDAPVATCMMTLYHASEPPD